MLFVIFSYFYPVMMLDIYSMLNTVKVPKLEVNVCRNAACKSKVRASTCSEPFSCNFFFYLADELMSARRACLNSCPFCGLGR